MDEKAPRLDRFERWMLEVISHPEGVAAGFDTEEAQRLLPSQSTRLEDVVEPSKQLTAEERLSIYANAYFWRLVDVLAEDYPIVRHLLGPDHFYDTAVAYLGAHPSSHYSLSLLGTVFPEFVRDEARDIPHRDFLYEVAVLENSIEEVFDASGSAQMKLDDLLSIPQEKWGDVRFQFIAAIRLHNFRYPVNRYFQARREDRHMDVPEPETSWVAVYRKEYNVWRLPLDEARFTLLAALAEGKTLGDALEHCVEHLEVAPETFLAKLEGWFQDWTAEGFFARAEVVTKKAE